MIKAPPTPKGFRDILPEQASKRREVINTIANVLEKSGFSPVETPTVEFAETLKGKYGEEEKLIYEFSDRGGRDLALRYDLTVPLARFVASNLKLIERGPFRRYQIGQVFRGEKPQKGRFREFTQFDFDVVGSSDVKEDAKVISVVAKCFDALGFSNYKIKINDRSLVNGINPKYLTIIDKLNKIGKEGVIKELKELNAEEIFKKVSSMEPTQRIVDIMSEYQRMGNSLDNLRFENTLVRGLNYYTGMIFEVEVEGYGTSVAGGGRYDNLVGSFAKKQIPAVGGSFGIDRLIEALG